jgi:hypothetical protein
MNSPILNSFPDFLIIDRFSFIHYLYGATDAKEVSTQRRIDRLIALYHDDYFSEVPKFSIFRTCLETVICALGIGTEIGIFSSDEWLTDILRNFPLFCKFLA